MDPQYPLPYFSNVSPTQGSPFNSRVNNPSRTPYLIPTFGAHTQRPLDAARVSINQPYQSLPQDVPMADLDTEGSDIEAISGPQTTPQPVGNPDTIQRTRLVASLVGLTMNENPQEAPKAVLRNQFGGRCNSLSFALNSSEQASRRNSPPGQIESPTSVPSIHTGPQKDEPGFQGNSQLTPTASAIRLILSGLGVFEYSQDPNASIEQKQQYFKACHFFNQLVEFNFVVIQNWAIAKFRGKKTPMEIEIIKWMVLEQTMLVFYASLQKNIEKLKTSIQRESQYIKTLLFSIVKGMMIIDRQLLSTQLELNCLPQFQEYEKLPQLRECKIPSSTVYTIFTETLKKSTQLSQLIQTPSLEIRYDDLFENLNVPIAASLSLYTQFSRKTSSASSSQSSEQEFQKDFQLLTLAMACATVCSIRKGPLSDTRQSASTEQIHPDTSQVKRFSILIADSLLGSQKAKDILEQLKNPENFIIKCQYDREREKSNITFDEFRSMLKEKIERQLLLAPQILQKYFKESDPKRLADKIRPNIKIKKLETLSDHEVFIGYFRYLMQVFFIPNKRNLI